MNGAENAGRFFLDTNILVYAHTVNEPHKQPVAAALIADALRTRRGVISTQVVQEFLNLATRHARPVFSLSEAAEYMSKVLWLLVGHVPSREFYEPVSYTHLDVYKRQLFSRAGLTPAAAAELRAYDGLNVDLARLDAELY